MALGETRLKAVYQITIGGMDVIRSLGPYLISVETNEKFDAVETGTCSIELDDSYAQLAIPPDGAPISVSLGWASGGINEVWTGVVSEVESGFARRGGGRRMWIDGKALNMRDAVKSRQQMNMGEGQPPEGQGQQVTLASFLEKAAQNAGIQLKLSPAMATITRDYWSQNESFSHLGARLARELGGVFQGVGGNQAIFVGLTEGQGVAGAMGSVTAVWGDNLIAWRVKPFLAKPQFGTAAGEYFDKNAGSWIKLWRGLGGVIPFGRSLAEGWAPNSNADQPTTDQTNYGTSSNSQADRSAGWVLIQGNPQARAGGYVMIQGARPGVDGSWLMAEVEHIYSRSSGYTTRCILANMGGGTAVGLPEVPSDQGYGEGW